MLIMAIENGQFFTDVVLLKMHFQQHAWNNSYFSTFNAERYELFLLFCYMLFNEHSVPNNGITFSTMGHLTFTEEKIPMHVIHENSTSL